MTSPLVNYYYIILFIFLQFWTVWRVFVFIHILMQLQFFVGMSTSFAHLDMRFLIILLRKNKSYIKIKSHEETKILPYYNSDCMFKVIVLLNGEPPPKSQALFILYQIFLQDCPSVCSIYSTFPSSLTSCGSKSKWCYYHVTTQGWWAVMCFPSYSTFIWNARVKNKLMKHYETNVFINKY